jgi:hypothetical protein
MHVAGEGDADGAPAEYGAEQATMSAATQTHRLISG